MVVVRLEIVDIEIEKRERRLSLDARLELFLDGAIPRESRERIRLFLPDAPFEDVPDAEQQLLVRVRLDEIVVRAVLKPLDLVRKLALRREYDDRYLRSLEIPADAPAGFESVDPRHHEIEEYEIGALAPHDLERDLSVLGEHDPVAVLLELKLENAPDMILVVHNEDLIALLAGGTNHEESSVPPGDPFPATDCHSYGNSLLRNSYAKDDCRRGRGRGRRGAAHSCRYFNGLPPAAGKITEKWRKANLQSAFRIKRPGPTGVMRPS